MNARSAAARARAFGRRFRVLRVAAALWRFARAHSPKWLLPVLAVCAIIPGPLDELFVVGLVLWPVLRSQAARRELAGSVRKAWGK